MENKLEEECTDFIEILNILRKFYKESDKGENGEQTPLQKKIEYAIACVIFWISNRIDYWSGFISVGLLRKIRSNEKISGSKEHPYQRTRTANRLLNEKEYESIKEQDFLNEFKEEVCLWHLVTSKENKELDPRRKLSLEDQVTVQLVKIDNDERINILSTSKKPEFKIRKMNQIDRVLNTLNQREIKILTNP